MRKRVVTIWKRNLAVLLAVSMVCTTLHIDAIATEPEAVIDINTEKEAEAVTGNTAEEQIEPEFAGEEANNAEETVESVDGITLSENTVVEGDYCLGSGVLDLNGYTMKIEGDCIIPDGTVSMNGGQLLVDGDLRFQARRLAETEDEESDSIDGYVYEKSCGLLSMDQESDYILVNGDFYMESSQNGMGRITDGRIELKGDFYQKNTYSHYNFRPSGENTVILSGDKEQKVSFDDCTTAYSRINHLELSNTSEEGVTWQNPVYVVGTITGDSRTNGTLCIGSATKFEKGTYNGDICTLSNVAVKEPLTINGNVEIRNVVTIYDKMTIRGNLTENKGYLSFKNGRLEVDGSLTVNDTEATHGIWMEHETDSILVKGDMFYQSKYARTLSDGVIEVQGNVTLNSGFKAEGSHVLLLSGDKHQTIDMKEDNQIAVLSIHNTGEEGVTTGSILNYSELEPEDATVQFSGRMAEDMEIDGDYEITSGNLDLNGHTLTVHGNLTQSAGTIYINGGKLIVDGDFGMTGDSYLKMIKEQDCVTVGGNFTCASEKSLKGYLTNGQLKVSGDFTQASDRDIVNFYPTGDFLLCLNGTGGQTVTFDDIILDADSLYLNRQHARIGNLKVDNKSEEGVTFVNSPVLCGKIETKGSKITGVVSFIEACEFADKYYAGSVDAWTNCLSRQESLEIAGNMELHTEIVLSQDLTIDGDLRIRNDRGSLTLNHHKLKLGGNLDACSHSYSDSNGNYEHIEPLITGNQDDQIIVKGDATFCEVQFAQGSMRIGGNMNVNYLQASPQFRIILDGQQKQYIDLGYSDSKFGILELANESREGVCVSRKPAYEQLITNGCKFYYGEGNKDAIVGYTLSQDTVIDGDLYVMDGVMDLNGFTLTVKGDYIQAYGTLDINGGSLVTDGDCMIAYRTGEEDYTYMTAETVVVMDQKEDAILVGGDFMYRAPYNDNSMFAEGVLALKGNTDIYRINLGEQLTVRLSGDTEQTIDFETVPNLEIQNSAKNIVLEKNLAIGKRMVDNGCRISGGKIIVKDFSAFSSDSVNADVLIKKNVILSKDFTVNGLLTVQFGILDINKHKLTVHNLDLSNYNTEYNEDYYATLKVNGNRVTVLENMTLHENAKLIMQDPDAYLEVRGNLVSKTRHSLSGCLTDGTLELQGDFTSYSGRTFVCSDNHTTILEKKLLEDGSLYKQKIIFDSFGNLSKFNKLILKKPEMGYTFSPSLEKICTSYEYDFDDMEPPTEVTVFTGESRDCKSITLTYDGATDESELLGYRIYRDGKLIADVAQKSYTDTGLSPDTAYTYKVYAYDIYKNVATESPDGIFKTLADETAPDRVWGLHAVKCSGSAITLEWKESADNVGVAGYKIYRNGEEIANVTGLDYRDEDEALCAEEKYTYHVTAVDHAGNESELSACIDASLIIPTITSTRPEDMAEAGGSSVTLSVMQAYNTLRVKTLLNISYYDAEDEQWIELADGLESTRSGGTVQYSYEWDISALTSGSYMVRYALTDEDGNKTVTDRTYILDRSAPYVPRTLQISEINGVVVLSWPQSESEDCAGYQIYRREEQEEDYCMIGKVSGTTLGYTDPTAEEGKTYTYAIKAFDWFGQMSVYSVSRSVTVSRDEQKPEITNLIPVNTKVSKSVTLYARAKDNRAVEHIEFFLQTAEKTVLLASVKTATLRPDNAVSYTWDTTQHSDGNYVIKAVAVDESGNRSDEVHHVYTVDNTGVSKLNFSNYEVYDTKVMLSWEYPKDDDCRAFQLQIFRNGSFQDYGAATGYLNTMVDGLTPETEYAFRVIGIDDLGNIGIPSDELVVQTSADCTSPQISIPNSSGIASDELRLKMTVTDNVGISHSIFSYSLDDSNYQEITRIDGYNQKRLTAEYVWDISSLPEGSVFVKYEAVDISGNKSGSDEQLVSVIEYKIDRTPPKKVDALEIQNNSGAITLTWSALEDEKVTYNIYRANGEGAYKLLKASYGGVYYTDKSTEYGEVYRYKVSATDVAGNEGETSQEIIVKAASDTSAPVVQKIVCEKSDGNLLGPNATFIVNAIDNSGVNNIKVYYREKKSDTEWTLAAEMQCSGQVVQQSFLWNTENLEEGEYEIQCVATDQAGNRSEPCLTVWMLDKQPPQKPELSIDEKYDSVLLHILTSDDTKRVQILRKKSGQNAYEEIASCNGTEYEDTGLDVLCGYEYKICAFDGAGNCTYSDSVEAMTTGIDIEEPSCIIASCLSGKPNKEITFDGLLCSDNAGIISYEWDFGDGNISHQARAVHSYPSNGEYEYSLTVSDAAGNSAVRKGTAIISDKGKMVSVAVSDADGMPLPGVCVMVDSDEEHIYMTDNSGYVFFVSEKDFVSAQIYKNGCGLTQKEIVVTEDEVQKVTMDTSPSVTGTLECHKMTYDEIVASGVDFGSEQNLCSTKFQLVLTFQKEGIKEEEIKTEFYAIDDNLCFQGGSPTKVGSFENTDGSVTSYELTPVQKDGTTAVVCMADTKSVACLNDMYCMELCVVNAGGKGMPIQDARASLVLPPNVSLASTLIPQKIQQNMGIIKQGEMAGATWIVVAAKSGEYELQADFEGRVLLSEIKESFVKKCSFECNNGRGLHLIIRPEKAAYIGQEYYIQYELVNESAHDIYAVQATFGKYETETKRIITIIKENGVKVGSHMTDSGLKYDVTGQPDNAFVPVINMGDTIGCKVLKAGKSIRGTVKLNPSLTGDKDSEYYKLVKYFLKVLDKENNGVIISVEPIEGHISKKIINRIVPGKETAPDISDSTEDSAAEPSTSAQGGDPINLMTGAFESETQLMTVAGVRDLVFGLSYDSTQTETAGAMGYGWHHNYESAIEDQGYQLILHDRTGSSIAFVSEGSLKNEIYGSYDEENGVVTVSSNSLEETFLPAGGGLQDYRIERNADGYILFLPGDAKNRYDTQGRLTESINSSGQSILLSYGDDSMVITDKATGKNLTCSLTDGRITQVTDGAGHSCSFTYDAAGNLASMTSKRGTTNHYTYDEKHRILTASDHAGEVYVVNTYDEKGRVLMQDDGDAATPLITLSYTDHEEDQTTEITYQNEAGGQETILTDIYGNGLRHTDSLGGTKTYTYNEMGECLGYHNADGSGAAYTRDESGNILTEVYSSGISYTYTYDEKGNLLTKTGNDGTDIAYCYNERNLPVSKTENGLVTTYTYNEAGQILTETTDRGTTAYTYTDGNVTKITYPDGKSDQFVYDAIGNVVEYTNKENIRTTYEIDAGGHVLSQTTELGNGEQSTIRYTYDAYGKVLTETDALGNTTTNEYDRHDRLVRRTMADGTSYSYTYDNAGNLIRVLAPDGTTSQSMAYDTAGNLKQVIDALKGITTAEYSPASRLIKATQADGGEILYEYDESGLLAGQTDARGNTTTYAYDQAGRVTTVTDPLGNRTVLGYDSYGNPCSVTDGEGNTVSMQYDAYGQITAVTDALGSTTKYTYDNMGNCIATTDALGGRTEYTYDGLGQITCIMRRGDSREQDVTIRFTYDALGNATTITDGEGGTCRMNYDKAGNVTEIYDAMGERIAAYTYDKTYHVTSVTDANGGKTGYSYDALGNRIKTLNEAKGSVTTYSYIAGNLISAATDALGGKTSATYDSMGNLKSFTNPNGGTTTYTYDKNQNVISQSVGEDYRITATYDAADRVETMTNSRGQVTEYTYDKAGRVLTQSDEAGTIRYTYDANGNRLTVSETVSDNSARSESENTITRTYDALNRVTSCTDAKGNTIRYTYDTLGNLTRLTYPDGKTVTYTYDKNGNVSTATDDAGRTYTYAYDPNGRLTETKRPDGSIEKRTYDKMGQLLTIKDTAKDGTTISDIAYTYDLSGNITFCLTNDATTAAALTGQSNAMEYDRNNRLLTYNGKKVAYDADGNMTYGPLDGEMAQFTYDCRNRLTEVTSDSGKTIRYTYDAENNRIAVTKNAGTGAEITTEYIVDSASGDLTQILQSTEKSADGEKTTTYYYAGNRLTAQEQRSGAEDTKTDGDYLLYHYNNVGSTTAITTETGAIKYTYSYTPYGQLLSGETHGILFLYNGQYGVQSDDNGLYYMRARYYNIDIKRFINQDILTGTIDSSQSLNRYAYVEGNPVSYLDPFGLDEYRVDTSWLHLAAGLLGILGGELSKRGAIAAGAVITAFANGFDIGLNLYDMYYDLLDLNFWSILKNTGGIVIDIIGIVTAGIASSSYKEAEYIAMIEKRITGYEELLVSKYMHYDSLGSKSSIGGYISMLEIIAKKIHSCLEEVSEDV